MEDLDRGLRLDLPVGPLLGDDAEALQREEGPVDAGLALHQELEGRIGHLEVVALMLELLEPGEDQLRPAGLALDVHAQLARLGQDGAAAGELAHQHVALVADQPGIDVLEGRARRPASPATCMPPLWANALRPT